MSVELFAINAVVDHVGACARLGPDIKSGDKTPITDGHIDFYSSEKKSNKTHEGRVPVQVKGRVTRSKVKAARDTQSFQVEREVLQFFRNQGGGIYFYVPMREGGMGREVFYAILLPFKVDRLLRDKPHSQKSFAVKMTRLPEEHSKIEGIVRLAWDGRVQVSAAGGNGHLLDQAESLTVHSLAGFDETRPTQLALEETDYVVVAHLPGGIEIALDVDLDVLPQEYTERNLAVNIACGGIEYSNGTGRRLDQETILINLSPGLEFSLRLNDGTMLMQLDLAAKGSFRAQAKDYDFALAAAAGNPLIIGDSVNESRTGDTRLEVQLRPVRVELAHLIELFDNLGIDDDVSADLQLDEDARRVLLSLHRGLVQDMPVRGSSNGTGRYDVAVGDQLIMVVVTPAEDEGFRRIIDPFDPRKRDSFRIYRHNEEGAPESIDWATVYEAVSAEDMAKILNLRLQNVVEAYAGLADRAAATVKANFMVLRLLGAGDLAARETHRRNLLQGAMELSKWLMDQEPDSTIHRINWWQVLYRSGELSDTDRKDIRAARRALDPSQAQARELEACMLILLDDMDELRLVIEELTEDEAERLRSWPVWALAKLM